MHCRRMTWTARVLAVGCCVLAGGTRGSAQAVHSAAEKPFAHIWFKIDDYDAWREDRRYEHWKTDPWLKAALTPMKDAQPDER